MDWITNADRGLRSSDFDTAEAQSKTAVAGNGNPQSAIREPQSEEDLVGEDAKLGAVAARISPRSKGDTTHTIRSEISTSCKIPEAPFYGSRVVATADLTTV